MKRLAVLFTMFSSVAAQGANLASVNNEPYTAEMFKDVLENLGRQGEMIKRNPQVREQFLDHIINNKLLAGEAKKHGLEKSDAFKGKIETAEQEILAQMYLESYLEKHTTDEHLQSYFKSNQEKFITHQVKASHILFKESDKDKATDIIKEAQASGADFAALAKKHSTGPSASKGGDLGFFAKGQMVPEFEKAAFSTEINAVHPSLVKTKFGYHIIKVTDKKGGEAPSFAEKKAEIARTVKKDAKQKIVDELRKKANVSVDAEALKKLKI